MRLALALAVAALLLGTGGPVRAQEESPQIDCGEAIDSDPATMRDRAIEHFNRARELYLDGQYDACVPEYVASYCLLAAPRTAFNLANAYLGLVDYENAVVWSRGFVRLAAP